MRRREVARCLRSPQKIIIGDVGRFVFFFPSIVGSQHALGLSDSEQLLLQARLAPGQGGYAAGKKG